jgi:hypothetical protein
VARHVQRFRHGHSRTDRSAITTRNQNADDTANPRPADAPRGEPLPPDTSKKLPDLPDPAEVGEDG